jgi:chromosome partitioning protein
VKWRRFRLLTIAKSAIAASDIVVIPVQPSPYDIWAAREVVDIIADVRLIKDNLKAVFTINRKIANTAIGRDVTAALADYPDIPVLKASMTQRVAFAESAAAGQSVLESEPQGQASHEIRALMAEIMELTNEQDGQHTHQSPKQAATVG